jgi:hypothetical protein
MATMKLETSYLETLTKTIACSPIVVKESPCSQALAYLPAGFENVDVAILCWIAADSRRAVGRSHH